MYPEIYVAAKCFRIFALSFVFLSYFGHISIKTISFTYMQYALHIYGMRHWTKQANTNKQNRWFSNFMRNILQQKQNKYYVWKKSKKQIRIKTNIFHFYTRLYYVEHQHQNQNIHCLFHLFWMSHLYAKQRNIFKLTL